MNDDLKLAHIISIIAEDFGWEVDFNDRRSLGGAFDRIQVTKQGKKPRNLFFDGNKVFICQSNKCDHKHKHDISIHNPLFEETMRSWFPFFEARDSNPQWVNYKQYTQFQFRDHELS